jgi:nucleoid DNA-binding protein
LSSADWRHFGRLAGFTNPKPERRMASGRQPFARLVEANGQVYREAASFIAEIKAALTNEAAARKEISGQSRVGWGAPQSQSLRSRAEFHRDPRYCGDLHRADLAWARHAAAAGLSAAEIRAAIMRARDLSKKGSLRRQHEYAQRTADKAVRQAE